MGNTEENPMSDLTPTPPHGNVMMPIPVTPRGESRLVIATKFLSWLTATLLAAAVLVSLVSVTNERNDLQQQIARQTEESACRSAANANVNQANADKDILDDAQSLAQNELIVAIGEGNQIAIDLAIDKIDAANEDVRLAGLEVAAAVEAQQEALTTCSIPD